MKKYDFLIIGGGVAGMSFALKVARAQKYRIALCCKTTSKKPTPVVHKVVSPVSPTCS